MSFFLKVKSAFLDVLWKNFHKSKKFSTFCPEESGGLHPTFNYINDHDNGVRRRRAAENIFLI